MAAKVAVLGALTVGIIVLGMTQAVAYLTDEPMYMFTRDPTAIAGVPRYAGTISLLNNMAWAATAVLALFVAWLVRTERLRLGVFGALVLVLCADDSWLLHEFMGPEHGVPELACAGIYAVSALLLTGLMLRSPDRAVAFAFVLGGGLLATSLLVDQVLPGQMHLLEDGAKLLGTLVWLILPMIACRPARARLQTTDSHGAGDTASAR